MCYGSFPEILMKDVLYDRISKKKSMIFLRKLWIRFWKVSAKIFQIFERNSIIEFHSFMNFGLKLISDIFRVFFEVAKISSENVYINRPATPPGIRTMTLYEIPFGD